MCMPKMPSPVRAAAAPQAPQRSAETVKLNERKTGRGPNAARGRESLRTDVNVSGGAGANIPVMGG